MNFKILILNPLILFLINLFVKQVYTSNGDYSSYYQSCLERYLEKNCSNDEKLNRFENKQPFYLKLLGWNCIEECKYECMWKTVEYFQKLNYQVPQFYGKWPFIRILGIQEPISTLASILHFIINIYMLKRLKKEISSKAKLKYLWIGFNYMNLITWFWSTVFHTRDYRFTEMMDYYCAFIMVVYSCVAFFIRYITYNNKIKSKNLLIYSIIILSCLFVIYHIYYLSFVHFDYGYNMKVNIVVGLLNSLCWLTSSIYEYKFKKLKYTWRCIFAILIIIVTTILFEVNDFKPILWLADGHAMWHLTTILVPIYWYQFYIDDCNYYQRIEDLTHLD